MKFSLVLLVLGFSLLVQGPTTFQEQKLKPQSISTEPEMVWAELRVGDKKVLDVQGNVVFTPTQANFDDTLNGTLVFSISESERNSIAAGVKKSLSDIPSVFKKENVSSSFERKAQCPDLRFEFFVQNLMFDVSRSEIEIVGAKLRFQTFLLTFGQPEQELSQLLCLWAKRIEFGRGGTKGIIERFNKVLEGKGSDK